MAACPALRVYAGVWKVVIVGHLKITQLILKENHMLLLMTGKMSCFGRS